MLDMQPCTFHVAICVGRNSSRWCACMPFKENRIMDMHIIGAVAHMYNERKMLQISGMSCEKLLVSFMHIQISGTGEKKTHHRHTLTQTGLMSAQSMNAIPSNGNAT